LKSHWYPSGMGNKKHLYYLLIAEREVQAFSFSEVCANLPIIAATIRMVQTII